MAISDSLGHPASGTSAPGILTTAEISHYRDQGYLVIRELFPAEEIAALAEAVEGLLHERPDLTQATNLRVRLKPHYQNGEPIVEVFDPISDIVPVAAALTRDRRITNRLHDLYGEPACHFKDKYIIKPPGTTGHDLHQDWIGWPGFPESFLTVLIAVDPFTAEAGATEVFPRCHTGGYLSPKDGRHHLLDAATLPTDPVTLELAPGDVAIFGCFTPHRSGPNTSKQARRGYFVSYNAASDGGEQFASHYAEFHAYLREKASPAVRSHLVYV